MSEWISVSDKMPGVGQEVLIKIPVCEHYNVEGGKYRGDGVFYGAWCTRRGKGESYLVSHWMPMPE